MTVLLEHTRDRIEGGDEPAQLGGGEAMLAGEPVHESLDLGPASEGFEPGARTGDRAAGDESGGRRGGAKQVRDAREAGARGDTTDGARHQGLNLATDWRKCRTSALPSRPP